VGVAGKQQQALLVDALAGRYQEWISEKQCTLFRFNIIQDFRNLDDDGKVESIRAKALALIETEEDPKYRKKYTHLWKDT